ncbi:MULTISPECIES: hypothetical protein [unclassified Sphingomonas]|uniref:hypothetical protein n=1 Tax=Sphingomonas TaxID=13687 RepID=UPI001AD08C4E|nr:MULTISPECIES: hypothetical protein [unclassified Sphingomonas]MBN8809909.1 hypothetical protein [Sphingomonas sp.]
MDHRRSVRESERAAIERWFPASPLGPLFDPGTGDLLPAPAAAIPGWQAEAFARIDRHVEQDHVAGQVHGWLFGLFFVGLFLIAMAAHLPIGPTMVIGGAAGGAVLHGWPIWQLYRFRRDLRRLRERIRGELAGRVPIPRELAARFRRRNPWRVALHVWVWGLVALGIGAQHFVEPQDVPAAVIPAALAAVGIGWVLHFLSRRIDLRRG